MYKHNVVDDNFIQRGEKKEIYNCNYDPLPKTNNRKNKKNATMDQISSHRRLSPNVIMF